MKQDRYEVWIHRDGCIIFYSCHTSMIDAWKQVRKLRKVNTVSIVDTYDGVTGIFEKGSDRTS